MDASLSRDGFIRLHIHACVSSSIALPERKFMLVHRLVKVGYGGNKMRQRAEMKFGRLHGHESDRWLASGRDDHFVARFSRRRLNRRLH